MGSSPEEIRLRYLYRSVVLRGRVRLPLEAAKRLVGPDCAFHLYANVEARDPVLPPSALPGKGVIQDLDDDLLRT